MSKLKYNAGNADQIQSAFEDAAAFIGEAKDYVVSFSNSLDSTCENLRRTLNTRIEITNREIRSLDYEDISLNTYLADCKAKLQSINTKKSDIDSQINSLKSNLVSIKVFFSDASSAFGQISKFINEFEANNGIVSFESLEGEVVVAATTEEGQTIVTFKVPVGEDENGDTVYAELTLGELLNAFYTETMTSINSVYSASVVLGEDAFMSDPTIAVNAVNSAHSFVTSLTSNAGHLFGVATLDGIGAVLSAAGIDDDIKNKITSEDFEFSNWIPNVVNDSQWDDEQKEKYQEYLNSLTNSKLISNGAQIAAGMVGAFGLIGNALINYNEETDVFEYDNTNLVNDTANSGEPTSNGTNVTGNNVGSNGSNSSGNWSGSTSTGNTSSSNSSNNSSDSSSNSDKKEETSEDKKEDKTKDTEEIKTEETIKEIEVPDVTELEDASTIPETVEVDLGEKDYDQLARDAIEADQEAVALQRTKVIEEANQLFEAEDKTALVEKLKEYGYTDLDINDIIADRDLTINALVQGDYNKQLATKAIELATQDNVTDFDTSYDDGLCCHDFYNGEAEQLLTNMSADPDVITANTNLTAAEAKYTEAVTAANESITKMTESKTAMETVKTEITTEIAASTDNWRADVKAEYDAEVNTLKDTFVKENGTADKWNNDQILEYTKIADEVKTKYATEIQADTTKWTEEQINKYNESIETYNTAVKDATTTIEASNTAKTEYETAKAGLETARENFLKEIKDEYTTQTPVVEDSTTNGIESTTNGTTVPGIGISDQDILGSLDISGSGVTLGNTTNAASVETTTTTTTTDTTNS